MEVIVNLLNKKPPSKTVFCHFLLIHIIILLGQGVVADLKADREALLEFASVVGGGGRLGWSREAQICCDWAGVKCCGSRVVGLRLPGMGLSGAIPENTIERLDALRDLSLENNSLTGLLPSKLMNLKSLNVSNNNFDGSIPSSLSRFPLSSFSGNALLCGPPLMNQPCRRREEHDINSRLLLLRRLLKSKSKGDCVGIKVSLIVALVIIVILVGILFWLNWEKIKNCVKPPEEPISDEYNCYE